MLQCTLRPSYTAERAPRVRLLQHKSSKNLKPMRSPPRCKSVQKTLASAPYLLSATSTLTHNARRYRTHPLPYPSASRDPSVLVLDSHRSVNVVGDGGLVTGGRRVEGVRLGATGGPVQGRRLGRPGGGETTGDRLWEEAGRWQSASSGTRRDSTHRVCRARSVAEGLAEQ